MGVCGVTVELGMGDGGKVPQLLVVVKYHGTIVCRSTQEIYAARGIVSIASIYHCRHDDLWTLLALAI